MSNKIIEFIDWFNRSFEIIVLILLSITLPITMYRILSFILS
jgi:hypothetical protein